MLERTTIAWAVCPRTQSTMHIIGQQALSACLFLSELVLTGLWAILNRATYTVNLISAQTNQEGIKSTSAKQ